MVALELNNVSKKYRIEYRKRLSIKDAFFDLFKARCKRKEFLALINISLCVKKGEILGIIGSNGSGKTTLLKVISGLVKPSAGTININGRVAGLLELCSGFQENLTGRDNIFINGLMLGFSSQEVRKRVDSIIDFAGIGDFIDAPVHTYSSGMYLRLGFAIAAQIEADIILIDEVLAVGDEAFQSKCFSKILEFKKQNRSIIFVSHNLGLIKQLCDRAILMDKGTIVYDGEPIEVVDRYSGSLEVKKVLSKEVVIQNVHFKDSKGGIRNNFKTQEEINIVIEFSALQKNINPVFGIGIYKDDYYLMGPNTRDDGFKISCARDNGTISYKIKSFPFVEGKYKVSISIHDLDEKNYYDFRDKEFEFVVTQGEKYIKYGLLDLQGDWST